jgi:hypothetical protein
VHQVQWIAAFEDGLLGEMKYVGFAANSGIKGWRTLWRPPKLYKRNKFGSDRGKPVGNEY